MLYWGRKSLKSNWWAMITIKGRLYRRASPLLSIFRQKVSSFTRSKVTEGSQNLNSRSRDPDHALFWL